MNARSVWLSGVFAAGATLAVLALRLAGGSPSPASWQRTELYFGRAIPGGGEVDEGQWAEFSRQVVARRFPAGSTTLSASGQWLDPAGRLVFEDSRVVVLLHRGGTADDDGIEAIRREYVARFAQDAVMRVDSPAMVRF